MHVTQNAIMLLKHYPIWIETWSTSIYITSCGFLMIIHVLPILCCFINVYPHSVIAIIWQESESESVPVGYKSRKQKDQLEGQLEREREREKEIHRQYNHYNVYITKQRIICFLCNKYSYIWQVMIVQNTCLHACTC